MLKWLERFWSSLWHVHEWERVETTYTPPFADRDAAVAIMRDGWTTTGRIAMYGATTIHYWCVDPDCDATRTVQMLGKEPHS